MIEFAANHYDGVTSRARDVSVWLDEDVLHVAGLDPPKAYPLARVRIAPRVGTTFRALLLPDGARCETFDRRIVDELERRQGVSRLTALFHRLEGNAGFVLVVGLALSVSLIVGVFVAIPRLGERAVRSVPAAFAHELGKGALDGLDRTVLRPSQLPFSRELEIRRRFETLARSYPQLPLALQFRRGIGANALAFPDGTVIVTDELVKLAEHDDEIVAVMAHEIGHVHHRHGLRLAFESSIALVLASTCLGDVSAATTLSGVLPATLAQARYSREHETEADDFAVALLSKSGVDPRHLANLLRLLGRRKIPDPSAQFAYQSSHPPIPERIARVEAAAKKAP
jgi:hypothetical protein